MSPQRTLNPKVGSAQPLEAFFESAQCSDLAAFEAEHGSGFLIVTAASVDNAKSDNTQLLLADLDEQEVGGRTADLSVVVYALSASTAQAGHLVTVGRDPKHDLVIPDASVSRFHAYMKRVEDGTYAVQDMASTNGTTVNGVNAPARGAGPPSPVKPGDTIRFGQVQLTFTDARALREFVLQAAG
ncbi:MAG: FHA domain-containing protein [Deltaproteobacteria bacterium]|nr:FHA domain-containing protein [Deltaproteobacteria bacterium]MBW2363210.1 FHA domain-containing protein [Deltaproteobacteria bacterium]